MKILEQYFATLYIIINLKTLKFDKLSDKPNGLPKKQVVDLIYSLKNKDTNDGYDLSYEVDRNKAELFLSYYNITPFETHRFMKLVKTNKLIENAFEQFIPHNIDKLPELKYNSLDEIEPIVKMVLSCKDMNIHLEN